jgi:hypothetical protein
MSPNLIIGNDIGIHIDMGGETLVAQGTQTTAK